MTKGKNDNHTLLCLAQKKLAHNLDTLETTSDFFLTKSHESLYRTTLQKHTTLSKLVQLIDISRPERKKQYWKTYHCKNVLLQEGNHFTGSLCRKRWCQTCNRIKTAEMTNAYKEPILNLGSVYFVTLTRPNVEARQLKSEVKKLVKAFQRIKDNLRKNHKVKLTGMRKIEITYNKEFNTYHPHFHFIQQGLHEAQLLQKYWLKQFPNASIKAQNIKEITTEDDSSLIELFKYATKQITKDSTDAKAEDIIYRALEGMRIYQTYGKLKKIVSPKEAKDEINSADFIPPQEEIWVYDNELKDYTNAKNQPLINTLEIEQKMLISCATMSSS
jgi:plasmid rolling circle replication initiator protein Rep